MIKILFLALAPFCMDDTTRPVDADSSFLQTYATRELTYVRQMTACKTEADFYKILKTVGANSLAWKYLPFFHPVNGSDLRLTSFFGYRSHPISGKLALHKGVDISAWCKTAVYAAGGGIIDMAGWDKHLGNFIRIDHAFGWSSVYGHLDQASASIGQKVHAGELVGRSGNTGSSTGCHLHYGIYYRGQAVEPTKYFSILRSILTAH